VLDRDQWVEKDLKDLYNWSLEQDNYNFALSNPKFEFWLLLHFEDGDNITSSDCCSNRLKKYMPYYEKEIKSNIITLTNIAEACNRAKLRDNPPCSDWPKSNGSTIYRLVERILNSQ